MAKKLKRLATQNDNLISVLCPIAPTNIHSRQKDYSLLTPLDFAKKYRNVLFQPVNLIFQGQTYPIEMNTCTDPYCKWFGLLQTKFDTVKHKPSRYKLGGSSKHGSQSIVCNADPLGSYGMVTTTSTSPLSNWSIAEEMNRLATNDRVCDWEPDYEFHKEDCIHSHFNPFDHPKEFYKQGKSKTNSQRYQCKECKKITHVLPSQRESFTYHQKRNDILPKFATMLVNRTPVKRACEMLEIGSQTYYSKLEWMYRRCLEFNEKFEKQALQSVKFDSLFLNTDKMVYFLNNVRKKGKGGKYFDHLEDLQFPTHVVVSSDVDSRYVFRADVAYDWTVTLDDIKKDTMEFKEDHLNLFARKNARLREDYQICPQPPSPKDTQSHTEYVKELEKFNRRNNYIDGLHVNSTYTTIAHLWLIKQMLNVKEWRFVTDEDASIMTALFRVFNRETRLGEAHHFLCKVDKNKSMKMTYLECKEAMKDLKSWGFSQGYGKMKCEELALLKLTETFQKHTFHEMVNVDGKPYPQWAKNPIEHPIPIAGQGIRHVDCTTNLSAYEPEQMAEMVLRVNDQSTNNFIQTIRRRLSILERPLVTARGDGKSYIYSNFNPKYAQYALTILRTYYNFCVSYKTGKVVATPAKRLGITDKKFDLNDIIYFK